MSPHLTKLASRPLARERTAITSLPGAILNRGGIRGKEVTP
jgi:hypothetical protein